MSGHEIDPWTRRVEAKSCALSDAALTGDWMTVNALAAEFAALLQSTPGRHGIELEAVFMDAQRTIAGILPMAVDARDEAERELKQLAKGRKAVAAYR